MSATWQKRVKAIGKGKSHSFIQLPHYMLEDPKFQQLSPTACKALLFLATQYRGRNNGDLTIAWKIAKLRGWTSKRSLQAAVHELLQAGFVILTRQGGRNRCSLFALSWFPIDDCKGKLDAHIRVTGKAPQSWKTGDSCAPNVGQVAPNGGQSGRAVP